MVFKLVLSVFLVMAAGANLPVVASDPTQVTPRSEPDGSRPTGKFKPFKGSPEPPEDLRAVSHRQAMVDAESYLYEVYSAEPADPKAMWIVRYLMFPEGIEACREIEQVYLFAQDLTKKPKVLKPEELVVDVESLSWKGKTYKLVDRRDLTTRS